VVADGELIAGCVAEGLDEVAVACGLSAPDDDVPPQAYAMMSVTIANPTSTTPRRRQ
jgi:hypothetical protein